MRFLYIISVYHNVYYNVENAYFTFGIEAFTLLLLLYCWSSSWLSSTASLTKSRSSLSKASSLVVALNSSLELVVFLTALALAAFAVLVDLVLAFTAFADSVLAFAVTIIGVVVVKALALALVV